MKDKFIILLASILVIALGMQTYMLFRLNARINELSQSISNSLTPPINHPKLDLNNQNFKDEEWNPYKEIQHLQREIEQLIGGSYARFQANPPGSNLSKQPAVDLQEKPERYVVAVNVPGVDETSLVVKLKNQHLHISLKTAAIKTKTDETPGHQQYLERFSGEYKWIVTLPGSANAEKMLTAFHNGVLTVTLPKVVSHNQQAKSRRDHIK